MQRYDKGKDREQIQVMSLEELIEQDNPVRVIDAFINGLDMNKLGFKYAETKETGRKPKDPSDMCKLYVYCYYNGIRSSRKIENECTRNIEIMWLTSSGTPHNKTISDFRKDNKEALENVFKEFSMLCDMLGLIGKEMEAIDGSKFRASNSRRKNLTKNKVKKMIKHHEESAQKYIELIEENDKEVKEQGLKIDTKEELQEKLEDAQKRIEELKEIAEEIEKNGNISLTDKDSKHMSVSNNGTDISHNVQVAVDSKNHLIVAVDVTSSPADQGQLYNMASLAAKELGIELKETTQDVEKNKETISEEEILEAIGKLNNDPDVDGFIVQLPLPDHISESRITEAIDPEKDADGFHPVNLGRMVIGIDSFLPATPFGIVELLKRYNIETSGKEGVVIGRSNIVGRPLSILLSQKGLDATVTVVHSRTKDIASHLKRADIIVAALGSPGFVKADMVKPGAVVIDVGTTRLPSSTTKSGWRLAGDVDFENVAPLCSYITPVPGGVGPMTRVALLRNTLKAVEKK